MEEPLVPQCKSQPIESVIDRHQKNESRVYTIKQLGLKTPPRKQRTTRLLGLLPVEPRPVV
jgi:hypothetical protein